MAMKQANKSEPDVSADLFAALSSDPNTPTPSGFVLVVEQGVYPATQLQSCLLNSEVD